MWGGFKITGLANVAHDYSQRVAKVRKILLKKNIDALLVYGDANRRYLSGFDGSNGYLIISAEQAVLATDFRYIEQAHQQSPHLAIYHLHKRHISEITQQLISENGWENIAVESDLLSYANFKILAERLSIPVIPTRGILEKLRAIKEEGEINLLRRAALLTDEIFGEISEIARPGVREQDVALELEMRLRSRGGETAPFKYIVASGIRGAWPHGVAGEKILEKGEVVTIDFGISIGGYCSDLTRNIVLGKACSRQKEIWRIVSEAHSLAVAQMRQGMKCSAVDELARKIIRDNGLGENFGHGVGHGVGLEAHEKPVLNSTSDDELVPGMVVTIEPGVYIPGWGGMRIEDMVLIKNDENNDEGSVEILTKSSRELLEI